MSPDGTIGVAVVGAGLIGRKRLEACTPPLVVRGVFDIDAGRTRELAASASSARAMTSLDEVLCSSDVELVVIATTHDQLAGIALQAARHAKHILIEKPAALDAAELRAVEAAARETGSIVRVGYNHRFHPSIVKAKSFVKDGRYGDLLWIRARYGHGGRPGYEREWRAERRLSGGGELIDQGSHLIDLVRFFVGDATVAFAELPTSFWDMEVEDNAFVALRPLVGGFAWLHASWSEWKNTFSFELTLQRAKLEVNGLGGSYGTERLTLFEMAPEMGPPATTTWEWPFPDRSWAAEMNDVAAGLAAQPTTGAAVSDGIAVLDLVGDAYRIDRSHRSGSGT